MIITEEFKLLLRTNADVAARQSQILVECRRQIAAGECDECKYGETVVAHRVRGLGDAVEVVTRATGIKAVVEKVTGGCGGCGKRRDQLNELVPFAR